MFAGPVCHFELVRIARRGRMFAVRSAFGLLLLGGVALAYSFQSGPGRPWYSPGTLTIAEMSRLGEGIFFGAISTLAVLVVGLTPGLVADAIASDRERKTLHYLLASRLTSAEIVLGKLSARLINLAVFPVLALPVMSLLTLLGGVSPLALVLAYAALAGATYFLAGMAVLVSVLTRRAREAVGAAYTLTALWLVLPSLSQALAPELSPPWAEWARWALYVSDWIGPPSPFGMMTNAATTFGGGSGPLIGYVRWMVAMQAVYGTLFVLLAAWQLRPAFRRIEGRAGRVSRTSRRWFRIPPCGDEPVYWKEACFAPRAGGLVRNLVRVGAYGVLAVVLVGAFTGSLDAFREAMAHGYRLAGGSDYQYRFGLNMALRYGTGLLFVIWMLWLGGLTAGGIAAEREQDTWISLLSTPLEARDILRGKMLGPLRATAHFGVVIVALWVIGVVAGAVHPLGFLNALVVLAAYTWFMVALGTYTSFKSQSAWRARLWTQGLLVAPHVCCVMPVPSAGALLGLSLWSYAEIDGLFTTSLTLSWSELGFLGIALVWYVGGILGYAGAGYFQTVWLLRGFDAAAGRPRRKEGPDVVLVEVKPDAPAWDADE